MKKIPSLFVRDYSEDTIITNRKGAFLAIDKVTPGCEWVINGEGVATRKWDGTAVLYKDGKWFKRYDAKVGRTPPPDFFEAQPEPDPITGHWPGWVPVEIYNSADRYIVWAINQIDKVNSGETFEAVGPKINGNKDGFLYHCLKLHGEEVIKVPFDRTFSGIKDILEFGIPGEGIVFHHPDGRMCKVKRSDFGLPW